MRSVAVAGVGTTPFGKRSEDAVLLGASACRLALEDAGVPPGRIEAFFLANFAGHAFSGHNHLAPKVAHAAGLGPIPCTRVEDACASGGVAFRLGVQTVASGAADFVLVAGVEKMTAAATGAVTSILSAAGDIEAEVVSGATFPALFALIARRHMAQYGTPLEALAEVAVKNHAHGANNPNAHFQKTITRKDVLEAKPVAEPLGLYDCAPISDGAAAAVLCPAEMAADLRARPVRVLASAQAADAPSLVDKKDITQFEATRRASEAAFRQAGLTPEDVDFAEVHDCFTIAEIVALEDIGFFLKGDGGRATLEGHTAMDGALPVNPSGGLKAKGHPVGATGLAQVYEAVRQLQGDAGRRQVPGAEVGLCHNLGGSGATCTVHIFSALR